MSISIILDNFPFLTVVKYADKEYVGIVSDSDDDTTSFYPYSESMSKEEKNLFLKLGLHWWWETNRKFPISISLYKSWKPFSPYIINFVTKDLEFIGGRPLPSLEKILFKKTKRKNIRIRKPIIPQA